MLDFKLTKFDNGLRLITCPLENTKAVSVLVLVGTGSRYEGKKENGIAHFLEHMVFKGTEKRPKTIDISRELDAIGANYNAFTSEEYTGFYVRAESSHFNLALDVLTDILYNSKVDEAEIEKEKGVIVEEINMIQDVPSTYVDYVLKELLWGDQPLGRTIAGTKATVTSLKRENFIKFKDNFYQPENIIIVIAGGKNNENWEEKVKEFYGKLPAKKAGDFLKVTEAQTQPGLKIHYKKTDQAHFVVGFRAIERTNEKRAVLKVLNNIMGATMSSRLFIEVREARGLCYYISTDLADYRDTGFWGASAGVDIKRIEEAIMTILTEFKRLTTEEVTDEELSRAKENLKGQLYLGLEESMSVAQFLAEQELFWEKLDDPDKVVEDYQKVTKQDIMELARELFKKENLNLAIVGPFKDKEVFEKILKEY